MFSVNSLQPAITMSISPFTTKDQRSTMAPRVPSPEYVAGRIHSIANFKLRLEASQNEPRLRRLLGHISVYDAIREYKQTQQPIFTSPPAQRRREQQLRRRQQMCETASTLSSLQTSQPEDDVVTETPLDNASEIQAYLSTIPDSTPSQQTYDFTTFQSAIAYQLATLSQVRIEAASRQLYHMTQDDDDADELAVEEYASSDNGDSDYDSYDGDSSEGENDWRDEKSGGWAFDHPANHATDEHDDIGGDSDTDPDSVNSAPPSPIGEFPCSDEPSSFAKSESSAVSGPCYFIPLRPMPQSQR